MADPYGGLPPAPPPPPGTYGVPVEQRGPRPATVTYAVYALWLFVALGIVGFVVNLSKQDEIKADILRKSPNLSRSAVDAGAKVGLIFGLVFTVFYIALVLLVARGKNWARIVIWVFAGLGVLGGLVTFTQPSPTILHALAVVQALLDVAIIVLLALPASHPWFRRQQAYRH